MMAFQFSFLLSLSSAVGRHLYTHIEVVQIFFPGRKIYDYTVLLEYHSHEKIYV